MCYSQTQKTKSMPGKCSKKWGPEINISFQWIKYKNIKDKKDML